MCVDLSYILDHFFVSKATNSNCLVTFQKVVLKKFSSQSDLRRIFQAEITSGNLELSEYNTRVKIMVAR